MRWRGHYGAALLVYAPVGALAYLVAPELAVGGGAVVLWLATVPDYDLRVPFVKHRGVTHTLLFLGAVSGLLAAVAWTAGSGLPPDDRAGLAGFAFLLGVLGVGSHLLADAITPMGVRPLWPLSSRTYTLDLTPARNPVANWLLLAAGVFATAVALVAVARVG